MVAHLTRVSSASIAGSTLESRDARVCSKCTPSFDDSNTAKARVSLDRTPATDRRWTSSATTAWMLARSRGERQAHHDSTAKLEHNLGLSDQPQLVPSNTFYGGRIGLGPSHLSPQLLNLVGDLGD